MSEVIPPPLLQPVPDKPLPSQPQIPKAETLTLNRESKVYTTSNGKYSRLFLDPDDCGGKYWFDEEAADAVITFFETQLTHDVGELKGQPVKLDPWEVKILRDIFGWKMFDPETGEKINKRRFRKVFLFLPKKNGKSLLAAGVALYMMVCDRENSPEIYSCANDKKQAALVFKAAAGMVRRNPELRRRIKITDSQKVMASFGNGGQYITLSKEAFSKDGLNVSCMIYDEIHAAKSRDLYDTISSAVISRVRPLEFVITTAGEYKPESVGFKLYQYAKGVLAGTIVDERCYPVIYEAPKDADVFDMDLWKFVNPGWGVSVQPDAIQDKANQAKADPTNLNEFKRKHLNIWTNAINAWLEDPTLWPACKRDFNPKDFVGRTCYVGIDLADRGDITAVALIFPMDDGTFKIDMRFFIPEDTAKKKTQTDNIQYHLYEQLGWLKITPGDTIDDDFILDVIRKDCKDYKVKQARRDRWGSQNINTQLDKDSATKNKIVEHGQGFKDMSGPMKDLLTLIRQQRIHHRGDPILAWMMSNVVARLDEAGNIKPDKKRSTCRIDGVVALIMALAACLADGRKGSVYNKTKKLKVI